MTDVLIRNVPGETLKTIDDNAQALGLSRADYIRRQLESVRPLSQTLTDAHWRRFAELAQDLADPDIMAGAWQ